MLANLVTSMPFYVCTFWTVLLLLDVVEQRQAAKRRLLVYMVAAALLYMGHYVFFNRQTALLPVTDTIYCTTNLAVFPLYFLYLKELTEPQWNRRLQWLLLLPTAVIGTTIGTLYALMTPEQTRQFTDAYLYHNHFAGLDGAAWWQAALHHTGKLVFAMQIPPILVLGFRMISRYDQAVEANYADTDDKRLQLMKNVLVLFVVTSFISFGANLLGRYRFADSMWLLLVPSVLFSVLQFMLGFAGYRQQFTIRDMMRDMQLAPSANGDALTIAVETATDADGNVEQQTSILDTLPRQLTELMSRERLFLQPNLKITDVAERLHTNRTYVSRVLKEQLDTTFADFINRQRIDHACRLMKQQPDLSAADVATMSGFSSQSSFYRNFKKYMGCSPTDYQE